MRGMAALPGIIVAVVLAVAACVAMATTPVWLQHLVPVEYYGLLYFFAVVFQTYFLAAIVYRSIFAIYPLPTGDLMLGSREEFLARVHFMFFLLLFNSIILIHVIPIPVMRLIYLALGARIGANSFSAGNLLDPLLIQIGDNCVIGHNAVVFCHVIEGNRMALLPIRIGNRVTVGTLAVIMPGVTVGDGAIVSAGAVVTKGTTISAGEIWGGVPARKIR